MMETSKGWGMFDDACHDDAPCAWHMILQEYIMSMSAPAEASGSVSSPSVPLATMTASQRKQVSDTALPPQLPPCQPPLPPPMPHQTA